MTTPPRSRSGWRKSRSALHLQGTEAPDMGTTATAQVAAHAPDAGVCPHGRRDRRPDGGEHPGDLCIGCVHGRRLRAPCACWTDLRGGRLMPSLTMRSNVRRLPRRRSFRRAKGRAFTASRPGLAFSHTGDVTMVLTIGGGLSARSLYGGSSGRARVRPALAPAFYVRPRR